MQSYFNLIDGWKYEFTIHLDIIVHLEKIKVLFHTVSNLFLLLDLINVLESEVSVLFKLDHVIFEVVVGHLFIAHMVRHTIVYLPYVHSLNLVSLLVIILKNLAISIFSINHLTVIAQFLRVTLQRLWQVFVLVRHKVVLGVVVSLEEILIELLR